MAVQQRRKSRSRRDKRRTHDALGAGAALSTDPVTGETHRRHHMTEDGFYRGRKIIMTKSADVDDQQDEE